MNRPLYVTSILVISLFFVLFTCACSKNDQAATTRNSGNHRPDANLKQTDGNGTAVKPEYKNINWTDLLPDEDLQALQSPPDYLDDIEDGSLGDVLASQLKAEPDVAASALDPEAPNDDGEATSIQNPANSRYQQALNSTKIRPEFDGRNIRIPGFIVPLEIDDQQTVTTFFIVPFFGACLHMPPPPPNQILYAEFEPGFRLQSLYDLFWLKGTLSTSLVENDMATAAYSISVVEIEPYKHAAEQDNNNMVGG